MRFPVFILLFWVSVALAGKAYAAAVWVDTDPGCDGGIGHDPDDCLALYHLAARNVPLEGLSTVYGNVPLQTADRIAADMQEAWREFGHRPPVLAAGAASPGDCEGNDAVAAMAEALAKQPVLILALGPLTNISCLIRLDPRAARRIAGVVAVMGAHPGHFFHPAEGAPDAAFFGHGLKFSDLNFEKDPKAARRVLGSGIPVTLVPYMSARHLEMTQAGLDMLARQGTTGALVAQRSQAWLRLWLDYNGRAGFYPFDLVATLTVTQPQQFSCLPTSVHITSDRLIGMLGYGPARLLIGPLPWKDEPTSAFHARLCMPRNREGVAALDATALFSSSPSSSNTDREISVEHK